MKSKTNRKIELKKSTIAIPLLRKLTGGQSQFKWIVLQERKSLSLKNKCEN